MCGVRVARLSNEWDMESFWPKICLRHALEVVQSQAATNAFSNIVVCGITPFRLKFVSNRVESRPIVELQRRTRRRLFDPHLSICGGGVISELRAGYFDSTRSRRLFW